MRHVVREMFNNDPSYIFNPTIYTGNSVDMGKTALQFQESKPMSKTPQKPYRIIAVHFAFKYSRLTVYIVHHVTFHVGTRPEKGERGRSSHEERRIRRQKVFLPQATVR